MTGKFPVSRAAFVALALAAALAGCSNRLGGQGGGTPLDPTYVPAELPHANAPEAGATGGGGAPASTPGPEVTPTKAP